MEDNENVTKEPILIKVENKDYFLYNKLDYGSFGEVKLIEDLKGEKKYALKILLNNKKISEYENEIEIYKYFNKIDNTYIPKFYGSDKIKINPDKEPKYVFVMDYFKNKDLFYYIKNIKGIKEEYAKYIFKRIVQGIQFCHEHNVCHLDIKEDNIMLNDDFVPMIVDFGRSKKLEVLKKDFKNCKEKRGTRYYRCPETYIEESDISGIDADIFSLGVLLLFMVTRDRLFDLGKLDDLSKEEMEKYKENNYSELFVLCYEKMEEIQETLKDDDIYSSELKNLYYKMISMKPRERPKLEDVLIDPWLKEINEIESNKEKFKEFIQKYKNYMIGIQNEANGSNEVKKKNEEAKETEEKSKAMPSKDEQAFSSNLRPKKLINQKFNYKYFIKLIGYLNPVKFMNLLFYEIDNKYNDVEEKCDLEKSQEKLKFNLIFRIEGKYCDMNIKLYQLNDNEHIVIFDKLESEIEIFYEYFSEIKEIIKKIFE